MSTEYVFAYDALICADKRELQELDGPTFPVIVSGVLRSWCTTDETGSYSCLGAELAPYALANGLLIEVNEEQLQRLDQRHKQSGRVELAWENIFPLGQVAFRERVWTYLTLLPCLGKDPLPIVYSYLETVLNGCLEVGEEFARNFLETTEGWNTSLFDDLSQPKNKGVLEHLEHTDQVKKLLNDFSTQVLNSEPVKYGLALP